MEHGLASARTMGARLWDAHLLPLLASCHLSRGRLGRAEELMSEAVAEIAETEERFWEAELWRVLGDVKLAAGLEAGSEAYYKRALAVAKKKTRGCGQSKAATSLARYHVSHRIDLRT